MNDIFCFVKDGFLFNYANGNTFLAKASTKYELINKISQNEENIISWCYFNQMEANVAKFQVMISNETPSSESFFREQVYIMNKVSGCWGLNWTTNSTSTNISPTLPNLPPDNSIIQSL